MVQSFRPCAANGHRLSNMTTKISIIPQSKRSGDLLSALLLLWEKSVRMSHHFLSDDDIANLRPYVTEGLLCIETLIVASVNDAPVAFMGIQSDKIEMLFVAPEHFRQGIGKRLIDMAIADYYVRYVDVNGQNPDAAAFYVAMGFKAFERSETDGQGNHFPI